MANEHTCLTRQLNQALNFDVRISIGTAVTGNVYSEIVHKVYGPLEVAVRFNVHALLRDAIFTARSNRKVCNIVEGLIYG